MNIVVAGASGDLTIVKYSHQNTISCKNLFAYYQLEHLAELQGVAIGADF